MLRCVLALVAALCAGAPAWSAAHAAGPTSNATPSTAANAACGCPSREQVIASLRQEQAVAEQERAREAVLMGEGYGTVRPELDDAARRKALQIVHPPVVVPPIAQGRPFTPESRGAAARLGIVSPEQDRPARGVRRVMVSPSN